MGDDELGTSDQKVVPYEALPAPPCFCIEEADVLADEEYSEFRRDNRFKHELEPYERFNGKIFEVPRNFLMELAFARKCREEIMTFNKCFGANEGSVSKLVITSDGQRTDQKKSIDGVEVPCEDEKSKLKVCIINTNRYHPCAPPEKDLNQFDDLFNKRRNEFAEILRTNGYKVTGESYKVEDINTKYYQLSETFLSGLKSHDQLPKLFKIFKQNFEALRTKTRANNNKSQLETYFDFQVALKTAVCASSVSNQTVADIESKLDLLNDKDLVADVENMEKSIGSFFKLFKVQETCENEKEHLKKVDNKIKLVRALYWFCDENVRLFDNFEHFESRDPFSYEIPW